MTQKEATNENPWLALLILFVFSIAGGSFVAYTRPSATPWPFFFGLFFGFLIGLAVLFTVDYAVIEIRRK